MRDPTPPAGSGDEWVGRWRAALPDAVRARTDILPARRLVSERLAQTHASPSAGSAPQTIRRVSSANRAMMISLSSRTLRSIELPVLARWTVRPKPMGTDGVANVAIRGHRDRHLQVLVDPARLRVQRVSLLRAVRTAGNAQLVPPLTFLNASTPGTGAFSTGRTQRLDVQHMLPSDSASAAARPLTASCPDSREV